MSAAAKVDLNVDQGATFYYRVNLFNTGGEAFNLTGYTGNAQLRASYTSNTKVDMTVSVTGSSGLVELTMNAATTATLTKNRYLYDVELNNNGIVTRILEGTVTVSPNVTR